MKKRSFAFLILMLVFVSACDLKETVVTNMVHEDGSVTRQVTVRTDHRQFLETDKLDVPIDSTWDRKISWKLEQLKDSTKLDTVWYLEATKHFSSVAEINQSYQADSGLNRELDREAQFTKSFRWFTTVYRFSEKVYQRSDIDCPMGVFMSEEELAFAYLPAKLQKSLLLHDSLNYKEMQDRVETQTQTWLITCMIRKWIHAFFDLASQNQSFAFSREELLGRESEMVDYLIKADGEESGLSEDSVFHVVFGGQFIQAFKTEIDSAEKLMEKAAEKLARSSVYDMQIQMPGKITSTNGKAVLEGAELRPGVVWAVDPTFYFSQDYEMWVESRVNNYPAWWITAIFMVFVVVGLVRRKRK